MKSKRIVLLEWEYTTDESANYLDIDWPALQKKIGKTQTKWLLSQSKNKCQLILDRLGDNLKLVAEFYDPETLVEYHLKFDK
jgi:hypothetical protein